MLHASVNHSGTEFWSPTRLALLTLLGASFLHLGLNVANLAGAGIGLFLALYLHSWALLWLGLVGLLVSVFYTAPPLRLVHRGLGEMAVGVGFGPIMVLGAYYVQAHRFTWEAFYVSLPVAILISLVLYLNEIPDRAGDAAAGKRTLPVRWSKDRVIAVYAAAVVVAYALIAGGASLRSARRAHDDRAGHDPGGREGGQGPPAELRKPVRADAHHGRQHQAPRVHGTAAVRRLPHRHRRRPPVEPPTGVPPVAAPGVRHHRPPTTSRG